MWGVPGAILAVPLLAMVKIVCDRVLSLKILCIAEPKPA
jgi:predicted PurR-regulated permease PerM